MMLVALSEMAIAIARAVGAMCYAAVDELVKVEQVVQIWGLHFHSTQPWEPLVNQKLLGLGEKWE